MKNINNQSQSLDKIAGLEDLNHENAAVCSGGNAILYDGADLTGSSVFLGTNVPNLGILSFNDKASSVAVTSGKWQFFKDVNYQGTASPVFGIGTYNFVILNNAVSSGKKVA